MGTEKGWVDVKNRGSYELTIIIGLKIKEVNNCPWYQKNIKILFWTS